MPGNCTTGEKPRWRPDGSELWFHREVDWGKRLDLMAADPETGRSRVVLTETAETFIGWTANARYDLLQFLADGERFLWRSNRDGWYDFHVFKPWFGGSNRGAVALAQLGFVTFVVEERGIHGRGKAFRDVVYRDVFHPQVADDVATLRQLAAERPYMDLDRVGVTGTSYGGIATVRIMLLAPDVYHVGIAGSGRWLRWHARLYGARTTRSRRSMSKAPA